MPQKIAAEPTDSAAITATSKDAMKLRMTGFEFFCLFVILQPNGWDTLRLRPAIETKECLGISN